MVVNRISLDVKVFTIETKKCNFIMGTVSGNKNTYSRQAFSSALVKHIHTFSALCDEKTLHAPSCITNGKAPIFFSPQFCSVLN